MLFFLNGLAYKYKHITQYSKGFQEGHYKQYSEYIVGSTSLKSPNKKLHYTYDIATYNEYETKLIDNILRNHRCMNEKSSRILKINDNIKPR